MTNEKLNKKPIPVEYFLQIHNPHCILDDFAASNSVFYTYMCVHIKHLPWPTDSVRVFIQIARASWSPSFLHKSNQHRSCWWKEILLVEKLHAINEFLSKKKKRKKSHISRKGNKLTCIAVWFNSKRRTTEVCWGGMNYSINKRKHN